MSDASRMTVTAGRASLPTPMPGRAPGDRAEQRHAGADDQRGRTGRIVRHHAVVAAATSAQVATAAGLTNAKSASGWRP